MSRNGIVALTVLLTAGALCAAQSGGVKPMIGEGTRQVNIGGNIDDDGEDFGLSLHGSGGYFLMDGVEVGVGAGVGWRGDTKNLSASVFGEYNFDMGMPVVPYAGGSAGFGWMDTGDDSDSYFEFLAWGGARYFFIDYAAVGCDLALKLATEDIYNGADDAFDWQLRINTSWYF